MISKDKQYRTRDGREVRIYATDGGMKRIHGAIKTTDGWLQTGWYSDGRDQYGRNQCDLIEVKPRYKRTVWLNVYDNEVIHGGWKTKEEADKICHNNHRIACIRVDLDFQEGEGL